MEEDKIVSNTTMLFTACACYALWKRNGFGKQRLMQFIADVEQVNRDNEYPNIVNELEQKFNIHFPEIKS